VVSGQWSGAITPPLGATYLCGCFPFPIFRQITRCVAKGNLVSVESFKELPKDFCASPPKCDTRFALFAGEDNRCFLPDSQKASHEWLESQRPSFHTLRLLPRYGHLDVFMGQYAARDTYPLILEELERPSAGGTVRG
jgi:hypothetical protein